MKKLLLVLVCVVLATVMLVGCLPEWITPGEEEEEEVMEAAVTATLVEVEAVDADETADPPVVAVDAYWNVDWSIMNVGGTFIREYELTFKVEYPDVAKDYVTIGLVGNYLEVNDYKEGTIKLAPYGDNETPESVSVTWELSE